MAEADPPTPTEHEPDHGPLTDHTYDGIREYDNPTPGWWNWLFIATVVFAPVYFLLTLAAEGDLGPKGQYARAQIADLERKFGEIGELGSDAATILAYAEDATWMQYAENKFATNCASCHGIDGAGQTGPNLTDDYFIHIQQVEDIADVIRSGRANNAMPAQANIMHPNDIVLLSAYVSTMRGQNLPGKGPEGDTAEPWTAE